MIARMMARYLFMFLLVASAFAANAAPSRVALIISNSEYQQLDDLSNPNLDAANLARLLTSIGYGVSRIGGSRAQILSGLATFQTSLRSLEPGSVVLVYYSGHGFEFDGRNYIAPADAAVYDSGSTENLISFSTVIDVTRGLDGVAQYFFFDACRELPTNDADMVSQGEPPVRSSSDFKGSWVTAADGVPGGSPCDKRARLFKYRALTDPD